VPAPVVPPLPVVPPAEPPVVEPATVVLSPDVPAPAATLPVVPSRLIVPVTLAVSALVPPLDPQAASETLITARRQRFRAQNSVDDLIAYSS
jgi:hypothetical protein